MSRPGPTEGSSRPRATQSQLSPSKGPDLKQERSRLVFQILRGRSDGGSLRRIASPCGLADRTTRQSRSSRNAWVFPSKVVELIADWHKVGVARGENDEVDVRVDGLAYARQSAQHVDALLLRPSCGHLLAVDVEDRPSVGSTLVGVLEVAELNAD